MIAVQQRCYEARTRTGEAHHPRVSLVMVGRGLELPQEYVRVTQVTVRSSLSSLVPKLLSDGQALAVVGDGLGKVAEEVVRVTKVTTGAALGRTVLELRHQRQVTGVVLHRLLQAVLHLVAEAARFLGPHSAQVLPLGVVHVAQVVESASLSHLQHGSNDTLCHSGTTITRQLCLSTNTSEPHLVPQLLRYEQMCLAAQDGCLELAYNLECVAKVTRRFCYAQAVAHRPVRKRSRQYSGDTPHTHLLKSSCLLMLWHTPRRVARIKLLRTWTLNTVIM